MLPVFSLFLLRRQKGVIDEPAACVYHDVLWPDFVIRLPVKFSMYDVSKPLAFLRCLCFGKWLRYPRRQCSWFVSAHDKVDFASIFRTKNDF